MLAKLIIESTTENVYCLHLLTVLIEFILAYGPGAFARIRIPFPIGHGRKSKQTLSREGLRTEINQKRFLLIKLSRTTNERAGIY